MLKDFFIAIFLVISLMASFGCGKSSTEKPTENAAKTIETWAKIENLGKAGEDGVEITGMSQSDINDRFDETMKVMVKSFKEEYLLNDETATDLAKYLIDTLAASDMITASIKEKNDKIPVVELIYTPIDKEGIQKMIQDDPELFEWMKNLEMAKVDPIQSKVMLSDPETQKMISSVIKTKIIDRMPFKAPLKMDVKCRVGIGVDYKSHWTPENAIAVSQFLQQK